MKMTVDLSEKDIKDIMRYTKIRKKGPAITKFVVNELMLKRRRELSEKFLTGEWSVELPSIEELRKDRDLWSK